MRTVLFFLIALLVPASGHAGTWLVDNPAVSPFVDETSTPHPVLYLGAPGERVVRVCIDPSSPFGDTMTPALGRAIETINALQPSTENFVETSPTVPIDARDFESFALHELLHCVAGVGHVNVGPDIAPGIASLSTNSFSGDNGTFDLAPGADATFRTLDDPRADDVNFFWFQRANNIPFTVAAVVDSTTYSRDLSDLPGGHLFASNGNFLAADAAGFPDLMPVMEVVGFQGSEARQLTPDDTVNLRFGLSGLNEVADATDDYSIRVEFVGISTDGCNVEVRFTNEPQSFNAGCDINAILIGGSSTHFRLAGIGDLRFNINKEWFFGTSVFADGFESGDFSNWSAVVP